MKGRGLFGRVRRTHSDIDVYTGGVVSERHQRTSPARNTNRNFKAVYQDHPTDARISRTSEQRRAGHPIARFAGFFLRMELQGSNFNGGILINKSKLQSIEPRIFRSQTQACICIVARARENHPRVYMHKHRHTRSSLWCTYIRENSARCNTVEWLGSLSGDLPQGPTRICFANKGKTISRSECICRGER